MIETKRMVPVTKGKTAFVDECDYERVMQHNWTLNDGPNNSTNYAQTRVVVNGKRTTVSIHRFILDAPKGALVDHIDGNGLNNSRSNLRLATASQSSANRKCSSLNGTGLKGVQRRYERPNYPYRAAIRIAGKRKYLGRFKTAEEAHAAYVKATQTHYGEFARW